YVLRRILRRAVRYGRTLSFHEPFFYKLVDVLVRHMGDVFPEIRTKQKHIEDTLKREEEAFNRTLDKGIALFEAEVKRLEKSIETLFIPLPGAQTFHDIQYWDHPPHFQGMNYIKFSTHNERKLSPEARSIVLNSLRRFEGKRYELFALCVMPQGVHALWRPLVKGFDDHGNKSYWPREEILADLKSFTTSEINREEATTDEIVWKQQSYDNPSLSMKSDADLKETFYDICRRPWTEHVAKPTEKYPWLWIWNDLVGSESATQRDAGIPHERGSREASKLATPSTTPRVISGAFAFRLYDEQGFPIDLTQLMARERGLAIDVAEFDRLMENQRERARRAQKKQVIELSEIETKEPTKFIGYDSLSTPAKVLEVVDLKDKAAVILDTTVAYAEMGGQVGDTGELAEGGQLWRVLNTRKNGNTWLHLIESGDTPAEGNEVTLSVDIPRRAAIQRHHTVTHLLHWALHEVVSKEASQKGSFVGPDKLTFDFNSAALTPQQVHDVEQLVNERILENAPVTWTEVPYASVRGRSDIMQFFGDKYGETVRVVDIGGYSKELCAGTHTRATGEIGLFRIVSEAAIQAGVRRIEAVAGFTAYDATVSDLERLKSFAQKLNSPLGEIEKKLDAFIARQTELEKALKSARQREAASRAKTLVSSAETIHGIPAIISDLGTADPDTLQSIADALKGTFEGSVLLAGNENGVVSLVSTVSPSFVSKIQAGKLIQTIAPIMGGKGGGRPDAARGAGKDPSKISEALAAAKQLLAHG
ncbi:MAG TPA: alanine--tRNA ligase-related protein, partial [Chthoniobacterales bacterium]